jgi:hypothetical protein
VSEHGDTRRRVDEAVAIVDQMAGLGADARIFGGVGVVIHCSESLDGPFHREPDDIDLAIARSAAATLTTVLEARGYEANERFNALHGDTRRIFHGPAGKLDAFVGDFTMCHRLELEDRLAVDRPTLSVADLVLTKLQIVELSEKDASDLFVLLSSHEVGTGPGDVIDASRVASVLADDWGYWRTASETLERVATRHAELRQKVDDLWQHVEAEPKSRRFRMRARIGERRRWYELPEIVGD